MPCTLMSDCIKLVHTFCISGPERFEASSVSSVSASDCQWCGVGRVLWGRLKVRTAAHLEAQAKQKAKHDLEVADAAAQEERVALQQYQ